MSINKTYAVFGLGRYGRAIATELVKNGADVIAVDKHEEIVNELALEIPVCKCADVTDPDVIKQLDIASVDVVIICIANNLEASVMAITLCKEAGVGTIIAKCINEMHEKIFLRVGADKVLFPERESGKRLARNLLSSGFMDMFELSNEVSMVEIPVKAEWVGKNLIELNLRKKYSANVVAVIEGEKVNANVDPEMLLQSTMKLVVIAETTKLDKLKVK
ncbi:MAG: TrkA family potassium uptake protein [Clostridia bacterium]|nr:TrkA family potassium uptake protein [Clostridia bacterium]